MTDGGEHGGASPEEVLSALYMYSTAPIFPTAVNYDTGATATATATAAHIDTETLSWDPTAAQFSARRVVELAAQPRVVPQVDLVPSLAALMGVAVPSQSVGKIIPELFMTVDSTAVEEFGAGTGTGAGVGTPQLLWALHMNAVQLWNYVLSYHGYANRYRCETYRNDQANIGSGDAGKQKQREQSEEAEVKLGGDGLSAKLRREAPELAKLHRLFLQSRKLLLRGMQGTLEQRAEAVKNHFQFLQEAQNFAM